MSVKEIRVKHIIQYLKDNFDEDAIVELDKDWWGFEWNEGVEYKDESEVIRRSCPCFKICFPLLCKCKDGSLTINN